MEKWFDPTVYMQNKLAQMQATDPAYTMSDLVAAFAKAGFVGPEGYFQHFQQFGAAEEVAPNAYFNANEYYAAKAAQFYDDKFDGSELQIAQVKALINKEGMNAWTHYQQFGSAEGVNPSNAFDASDYCAAKAAAMNKAGQKAPDGTDWTAEKIAKAIDDAGMSVLEHYLTYAGTGEGEVAAGSTYPVADDDQVVVPNPGETFVLKEGIEQLQGTSGDDVFKAEGNVMDAGDVTDGGAGNDTLEVYGNAELKGTFTNIENLVIVDATQANNDKDIDLSAFSGSFTLKGGSDKVVTVDNVTGQKLVLDGTTEKITLTANMADTQTSANLVSQNAGNTVEFILTGKALTDVNLVTDGAKADTISGTDTIKNVNVTATGDADVALDGMTNLENVTVAGAGGVTVDLSSATKAVFTGGAGNDTITLNGSTKAHTLGAGDDTVVVADTDVTALKEGFSVDGGDDEDTLVMSATTAEKMTSDIFKAFTGFEVLGLNGGSGSINLNHFGNINQVTIAKALGGDVTIDNMDSNGILEFNAAANQEITVSVTDADKDGHSTDVLNVKLSAAGSITNAAKALAVAKVETINIEADDADDDGDAAHTLQLTADAAKTVKVTGDAGLQLSGTFAVGATIDISANTADVTFTASKMNSAAVENESTLVKLEGFTAGDKINIADASDKDTFGAKVDLGANSSIQEYLTAASKQAAGSAAWFEFGGDTYILFDDDGSLGADDYIVKLAGTDYDLKGQTFSATGDLTLSEGA